MPCYRWAGTGTNDVIDRCVELGLRRPEFRQDEDFMVVMWRKEVAGTVQSDPERSKSDPNLIQNDPNLVEQVYQLIVKDRSISRARLSELLVKGSLTKVRATQGR